MILKFQSDAILELQSLAKADRHSILLEGNIGSGKSYIAKQYVKMLGVQDFASVQPTVQSIREALDASHDLTAPVVFCIENLDTGVPAASFTLLKFLEEPAVNAYIIVTCRNRFKLPDTIISRSTCITLSTPTSNDINDYAQVLDITKYNRLHDSPVWQAVRSLNDVSHIFQLTSDQLAYYTQVNSILTSKDNVSNIIWKLGHYADNSEIDLTFMLNYIIVTNRKSTRIQNYAIQCMRDLSSSRIASHAILAKFVMECKYGE